MMFSVVAYILIALLLLCLVLLIASLHTPKVKKEKLPPCTPRELLAPRDRTLYKDLGTIALKHSLDVFTQVGLAGFLALEKGVNLEAEWVKLLRGYYVDFLLCDKEKSKPVLVVMQGQGPSVQSRGQAEFLEKACEAAGVPLMFVKDYNMAGLEKAMLEKAGIPLPKGKKEKSDGAEQPLAV